MAQQPDVQGNRDPLLVQPATFNIDDNLGQLGANVVCNRPTPFMGLTDECCNVYLEKIGFRLSYRPIQKTQLPSGREILPFFARRNFLGKEVLLVCPGVFMIEKIGQDFHFVRPEGPWKDVLAQEVFAANDVYFFLGFDYFDGNRPGFDVRVDCDVERKTRHLNRTQGRTPHMSLLRYTKGELVSYDTMHNRNPTTAAQRARAAEWNKAMGDCVLPYLFDIGVTLCNDAHGNPIVRQQCPPPQIYISGCCCLWGLMVVEYIATGVVDVCGFLAFASLMKNYHEKIIAYIGMPGAQNPQERDQMRRNWRSDDPRTYGWNRDKELKLRFCLREMCRVEGGNYKNECFLDFNFENHQWCLARLHPTRITMPRN